MAPRHLTLVQIYSRMLEITERIEQLTVILDESNDVHTLRRLAEETRELLFENANLRTMYLQAMAMPQDNTQELVTNNGVSTIVHNN